MAYHGEKWKVLGIQDEIKFARTTGPFYKLLSRDGSKLIFVKQKEDPDFHARTLG